MKPDLNTDVLESVARAHHCFWLSEHPPVTREVSNKLIALFLFLLVLVLTLLGTGVSLVAAAIYAVFFVFVLWLAGIFVFLRTGRLSKEGVSVLVEAYFVALLITVLLLSHNLFFPIKYFSQEPGVDRSSRAEITIAYVYVLPAALYLAWQSFRILNDRRTQDLKMVTDPGDSAKLVKIFDRYAIEIAAWSLLHFIVLGALVWQLIFANEYTIERIGKIIDEFKFW